MIQIGNSSKDYLDSRDFLEKSVKCSVNATIKNKSTVPNSRVVSILKFYRVYSKNLNITIKNTKDSFYGWFDKDTQEIVVAVAFGDKFPIKVVRNKTCSIEGYASNFYLFSQEEALVYLIGHELRHLWQKEHNRSPRKGRIKKLYSETDAEIYALTKLNQWRNKKCLSNLL